MKELLYFLGLVAAGALGYKFEPQLRSQLTEAPPAAEVIEETVVIEAAAPSATPAAPTIDLASLAPSQLPEKILLKTDAKVADSSSGIVMSIEAGNHVKPVRIEGENVVISPGAGAFVGKVAISHTDLLAQLAAKPPSPVVQPGETPVAPAPMPEAAAPPITGDSQEPPAEATPTPAPDATPAPEAPPMEEATPAPAADPTPAPAPAPEAPAAPAAAGGSEVVKAMQDSIKAAQIKEFTFEQVLNWEAGADETADGETYQTGLASYKAETIFGVKTIQAKALLKGGKVQRWIWPKSGMEIK